MEDFYIYQELIEDVEEICSERASLDEKLKAICTLIAAEIDGCDWVGFYLVNPANQRELILGPFVGAETEHKRIPIGRGICGMAAMEGKTLIVDDVSKEQNYLSCSAKVKSEIVVPIKKEGRVVAELDVDSHQVAAFDELHAAIFDRICDRAAALF